MFQSDDKQNKNVIDQAKLSFKYLKFYVFQNYYNEINEKCGDKDEINIVNEDDEVETTVHTGNRNY